MVFVPPIVSVMFGVDRSPQISGAIGKGIREFRKREIDHTSDRQMSSVGRVTVP
jgi:Sec-independent protein translocase protein TatA